MPFPSNLDPQHGALMHYELVVALHGHYFITIMADGSQNLRRAEEVLEAGASQLGMTHKLSWFTRRVEKAIYPLRWNPGTNAYEEEK